MVWSSEYRKAKTQRLLWHQGPKGLVTVPQTESPLSMEHGVGVLKHFGVPDGWERTVADRFFSVIDDMLDASVNAIDVIVASKQRQSGPLGIMNAVHLRGAVAAAVSKFGIDAKPETLISEVKRRRQDVRKALRELEREGKYSGFSRPPPRHHC